MQFSVGPHKWLRLLLLGAGCYLVLLPLWWYSLDVLTWAAGGVAGAVYHFFDPNVSVVTEGRLAKFYVSPPPGSGFNAPLASALQIDRVTYGLPMLIALVLITSAPWIARLRALALGLLIMFCATVAAIMLFGKMQSLHVEDQIAAAVDRTSFFFYLFHGYAFLQPVVAVVIWLVMLLTGFLRDKSSGA